MFDTILSKFMMPIVMIQIHLQVETVMIVVFIISPARLVYHFVFCDTAVMSYL